ncbi:hypothetical protein EVAR_32443_1 [Eumeta japonica]|uniref:Uncharacterized protein n=1 Tax=Eumeta variegata TaxID=151549 RepID=A0A4C1VLU7_EUMVA|nr:hypothetical protein EVAR_32443_1 [Eumeta japonica]
MTAATPSRCHPADSSLSSRDLTQYRCTRRRRPRFAIKNSCQAHRPTISHSYFQTPNIGTVSTASIAPSDDPSHGPFAYGTASTTRRRWLEGLTGTSKLKYVTKVAMLIVMTEGRRTNPTCEEYPSPLGMNIIPYFGGSILKAAPKCGGFMNRSDETNKLKQDHLMRSVLYVEYKEAALQKIPAACAMQQLMEKRGIRRRCHCALPQTDIDLCRNRAARLAGAASGGPHSVTWARYVICVCESLPHSCNQTR